MIFITDQSSNRQIQYFHVILNRWMKMLKKLLVYLFINSKSKLRGVDWKN